MSELPPDASAGRQRIDKWLWYARIVKSRTLAQKLAVSGRVRVNRERNDSASRLIKPGDTLTIALGETVRILRVLDPGSRRGPAEEARRLYDDLTPPPEPGAPPLGDRVGARPTKRDRRRLATFMGREDDFSDRDP